MRKEKIIIYGMGGYYKRFEELLLTSYDVLAIADRDEKKWGYHHGIPVISPQAITQYDGVGILIVMEYFDFSILNEFEKLSIDIKRAIPFFRPGYLKQNDYTAAFEYKDGRYVVRVDLPMYNISFFLQKVTDMSIFGEIYLNNEYRVILPDDDIVVIDIGMNVGLATLNFAKEKKVRKVYSFEPFTKTYKMALENININAKEIKEKIKAFNLALSNYVGEEDVPYEASEPGNMRIVTDMSEKYDNCSIEHINVVEAGNIVHQIVEENKGSTIVIKCDCEGSEYKIFENMDKYNMVGEISAYLIETHLGRGDEIINILLREGFKVFAPVSRDGELGLIYACK